MPYNDTKKDINVNYTNKDFSGLKNALIEYAKAYYPNTYRDFNETSPGMMLIEMSAYVGDVLNFYIDNQYRESMLPLADERRNIINLAKALGYKVKPSTTSFVDLKFTQTVGTTTLPNGNIVPNYTDAVTLDSNILVNTAGNTDLAFETLAPVDFRVSSSIDIKPEATGTNADGLTNEYTLTRHVQAIGGKRKSKVFSVGSPTKFLELKLDDTDVIEVISVTDSNGNIWNEVDYLAQDKVRVDTFYSGSTRNTAYDMVNGSTTDIAVPFLLEYKKVSKRFITQTNEDNTTSIIFGNGVLRNGQEIGQEFLDLKQTGLTIPGETSNLNFDEIDLTLGDSQATLGEAPFNTSISVVYRVAKGLRMNVTSNEITSIDLNSLSVTPPASANLKCTNEQPAYGASHNESIEEIRQKALAFFTTQNRCVTKEDYEARSLNMPAKFGQIAKIFVNRGDDLSTPAEETDSNRINIYTLTYDNNKHLKTIQDHADGTPHPIKQNLKNYLSNYKMLTDDIYITNGYVINFGVVFDVIAHRDQNKQSVKLQCIQKIKDYFTIDRMQFHQVIYTSDLVYELSSIDGVRAVNFVELTQDFNLYNTTTDEYTLSPLFCNDNLHTTIGECNTELGGSSQYGWLYNFKQFYDSTQTAVYKGSGIVLPAKTPSVFELKNPNQNIIGVVH